MKVWGVFFTDHKLFGIYETKQIAQSVFTPRNCTNLYVQEIEVQTEPRKFKSVPQPCEDMTILE